MNASLDFGYPWWLSYGHLTLGAITAAGLAFGAWRQASRWLLIFLGAVTLWALSVFLLIRFGVGIDTIAALPTQNFLRSGTGQVLDLGAGTGRSAIMLLTARPQAKLLALDLFGDSFDEHFGKGVSPQDRLRTNLRIAGVEQRASIVTSDMRKLPFPDASFEGVISSYAVDHLPRAGVKATLAETARVLKPGGDFLLVVVNGRDPWLRFAFGPLLAHGGFRGNDYWTSQVAEAGLQVAESGTTAASFYVLSRKASASE